jgi:hypothetical protein
VINALSTPRQVNADIQQAEYFLAVLGQERAEAGELLAKHRTELLMYEHIGDVAAVRRRKRVIRALEKDVFAIDQMVRALWQKVAPTEEPPAC